MDLQRKELVEYLLLRWFTAKSNAKEEALLFRILEEEKADLEWEDLLENIIASETEQPGYRREEWQSMIEAITGRKTPIVKMEPEILGNVSLSQPKPLPLLESNRRLPANRRRWIRWVAAAVLVFIVCSLWFVVSRQSDAGNPKSEVAQTNDVAAPKQTRAVITLADGTKVYLDSVGTGTLATQANVTVEKSTDGKVVYNATNGIAKEIAYNTLTNPRGSKVIDMQLSDGSHVWLNAGSSVKYPVAFVGNERKVEITGEAYFEVAHDAKHPFIVSKGNTNVTVLGTHFNVNAYDDEETLKVTLLEGSVKVDAANKSILIKPGEQAQVNGGNAIGIVVNRNIDVDEVMAWKNGTFSFNNTDLRSVMRQIARWYDVDVDYQGNTPNKVFVGEIDRTVPVSKVLQMMEYVGVKFKIDGNKITVMQ